MRLTRDRESRGTGRVPRGPAGRRTAGAAGPRWGECSAALRGLAVAAGLGGGHRPPPAGGWGAASHEPSPLCGEWARSKAIVVVPN